MFHLPGRFHLWGGQPTASAGASLPYPGLRGARLEHTFLPLTIMKLLTTLALLSAATVAAALNQESEAEHESCCQVPAGTAAKVSYLARLDPLPAGTVTGKVTGRVVFDGERPEIKPLQISEKQAKGCTDGPPVDPTDRSLLLSKEGGIQYAVVTIDVDDAELKIPEEPIEIDQMQCRYEPHVILMPEGSTVAYKNSDKISHNVHTYAVKNRPFNKTIAPGGAERQVLDKSEAIKVACDIHPWMSAYMFVTDTPYAAITDADGNFAIDGLPAGEYRVNIWHERLGRAKAEVTVAADGSVEPLEVKMGEKKQSGQRRRR